MNADPGIYVIAYSFVESHKRNFQPVFAGDFDGAKQMLLDNLGRDGYSPSDIYIHSAIFTPEKDIDPRKGTHAKWLELLTAANYREFANYRDREPLTQTIEA